MIHLAIRKDTSLGLKDQIKRQIRAAIVSGSLVAGERIPSSHDLAIMLHVNRNTVAQAYRELVLEGYMQSTVGSGSLTPDYWTSIRTCRNDEGSTYSE